MVCLVSVTKPAASSRGMRREERCQSSGDRSCSCDRNEIRGARVTRLAFYPSPLSLWHSQPESASDLWGPQAQVKVWALLPPLIRGDSQHDSVQCGMSLCPCPGPLGNCFGNSPLKIVLPTSLKQKFTHSIAQVCWYLALFLTLAEVSLSFARSHYFVPTLLFHCGICSNIAVLPRFKIINNRDQKSPQIISPPSWMFPRVPSPNLFSPVPCDFTNRAFSNFLQ